MARGPDATAPQHRRISRCRAFGAREKPQPGEVNPTTSDEIRSWFCPDVGGRVDDVRRTWSDAGNRGDDVRRIWTSFRLMSGAPAGVVASDCGETRWTTTRRPRGQRVLRQRQMVSLKLVVWVARNMTFIFNRVEPCETPMGETLLPISP